ncbi:uncharacterized protein LOC130448201 isoform X1 [Diorhabda sublineata]|uniref:uncharacterized protein LOC130448201 isoform X1 n=2 Tax=Diorhabda sublineata TaxID=1163346 RepID=UPI0024E07D31|nr:uncharacterized protein LOC130448201 isoform X1 [Diorhabda sublineata]
MESVWYDFLTNNVLVFTVLIGLSVLIIMYVIKLFKEEEVRENMKSDKLTVYPEKKKDQSQGGKRKKKIAESRWTGKHDKYVYSHPWILTSLKGHTGKVLDMDFSSNGKFLASCDDEDPDPGGKKEAAISEESNKDNVEPTDEKSPRCPKGLSRRQRKNRKRDDSSPPGKQKLKKSKPKKSSTQHQTINNNKKIMSNRSDQWDIPETMLYDLLQNYLLSLDQMMSMGYPIQTTVDPGAVAIYKSPSEPCKPANNTIFNLNAMEFVPRSDCSTSDSGQGSAESGDSGDESTASSCSRSSRSSTSSSYCSYYDINNYTEQSLVPSNYVYHSRICCRCETKFYTTETEYMTQEGCVYHWGKLQSVFVDRKPQVAYSCCSRSAGTPGCTEGKFHVWNGVTMGMNGFFDDFISTKPRRKVPQEGHYGVYALDCEMCYTVRGLEVTKVTVVGIGGKLVYDSFVKPDCEIVDYNTRFSGITKNDITSNTKSLADVQKDLLNFINAKTILIGHGLENDLRALKIVHYTVIDTAQTFPHYHGLPYRRSLKNLTSTILKRTIQGSVDGHDSYEDANACLELMLWKVRKDLKKLAVYS